MTCCCCMRAHDAVTKTLFAARHLRIYIYKGDISAGWIIVQRIYIMICTSLPTHIQQETDTATPLYKRIILLYIYIWQWRHGGERTRGGYGSSERDGRTDDVVAEPWGERARNWRWGSRGEKSRARVCVITSVAAAATLFNRRAAQMNGKRSSRKLPIRRNERVPTVYIYIIYIKRSLRPLFCCLCRRPERLLSLSERVRRPPATIYILYYIYGCCRTIIFI